MNPNDLMVLRQSLRDAGADAYVLADYENRNPLTTRLVGSYMLTRKLLLIVPKEGRPLLIAHLIDSVFLKRKEVSDYFDLKIYRTWKEMLALEKEALSGYHTVLMDVSEDGLLPRISLADYGSVSFVLSLGLQVRSSQDLLQRFTALYDESAYQSQLRACKKNLDIKDEAFRYLAEEIRTKGRSDEYDVQQFIVSRYHDAGMVFDDPPIVAVNAYSSNPHYAPSLEEHHPILEGDVVLIDMWAKEEGENRVYSDITWMGYVGTKIPAKVEERFLVLRHAVDHAVDFLSENLSKRRVEGYEVDDVVREDIEKAGYGPYFTHRTGHNIAVDVSPHGPGVNIDDYESHDTREILDGITFSLEPGIYAPDFGMRLETDCRIEKRKPVLVGGRQTDVIPILCL
jgi:Xaa-Pro aminopeptidase